MADVSARNARLDKLSAAAKAWSDSRTKQLNDQVALLKNILKGRTGSERLAHSGVNAASDLVVTEINDFLAT